MRKISVSLSVLLIAILLNMTASLKNIKMVNAARIQKTEYVEAVYVTGEFENINTTDIKLSYPVYIKDVFVKENDYVCRGQALFSLDTEKMQSALNGEIDGEILDRVSYNDLSAVSDFSAFSYLNLADTVYAPADGVVTEVNVHNGAFVMKNSSLASVADGQSLMARFTIAQTDFEKVKVGDTVIITPTAFPGTQYTGIISDKSAVIKKQVSVTGSKVMIDVFAHINDRDKRVSDGLQISGKIINGQQSIKNMLDYRFINQDDAGEYVYIFSEGIAEKVYITTGTESEKSTEILTAFSEDTIFLSGDIVDGDKVIITGDADEFL
ncbi:MAG: efflux RND transporter periplasmic adaptor subunit [Oscillospiraceae bacterium]|nr:efflux RND transporter periplasmic adaptor subunit [Oscillospiraceae bacterium]